MAASIDLIPTGCSLIPRTQAPSQGAGQTRPEVKSISRKFNFNSRAHTSEFREVVGFQQAVESVLPLSLKSLLPLVIALKPYPISHTLKTRSFHCWSRVGVRTRIEWCDQGRKIYLGNDVSDWASTVGLTERNSTVHASRSLNLAIIFRKSS